jgi:Bacterial antitoxin of ParD toxin-antitoxin type II system and RHH
MLAVKAITMVLLQRSATWRGAIHWSWKIIRVFGTLPCRHRCLRIFAAVSGRGMSRSSITERRRPRRDTEVSKTELVRLAKIANCNTLLFQFSVIEDGQEKKPHAHRNVNLTQKLDRLVLSRVKSGRFENANEFVRAALRTLEREERL